MAPTRPNSPAEIEACLLALGNLIKERRKPTNQDDFADQVGVYRSHMGQIENGKLNIRFSTFLDIAHALQMPPSELMRLVEERRKQNAG